MTARCDDDPHPGRSYPSAECGELSPFRFVGCQRELDFGFVGAAENVRRSVRFPLFAGTGWRSKLWGGRMGEIPPTRASLLVRLRDPRDHGAWRQFVDLYA